MRRLKVWVATPELHRRGGTERCLAEQMERWRERFDLRLYTMRVQDVDLRGTVVRWIPRLPGPHLFRYVWWFVANTLVRAWDAGRLGRPDVVHSTGINSADASVMSAARSASISKLKFKSRGVKIFLRVFFGVLWGIGG